MSVEWTPLHEAIAQGLMGAYGENLAPCELAYRIVEAASGIETEGQDRETGLGAEHESPTAESGDAQNIGDTSHD